MKIMQWSAILMVVITSGCVQFKLKMFEKFRGGEPIYFTGEKVVKFTTNYSHIISPKVKFNDLEISVVFDTGGMTIIDNQIADSLGLDAQEIPKAKVKIAEVSLIDLQGVQVKNLNASVMNFSNTFHTKNSVQPGMIGSDFIRFFQTTIDYKNSELIFSEPKKMKKSHPGEHLLPMTIITPYFPAVPVNTGFFKAKGMIDTGLNYAFVIPLFMKDKLPQAEQSKMVKAEGFFAKWPFTTETVNYFYVFPEIRVGDIFIKDVPVLFAQLPPMLSGNVILIGKYFMENYLTTLDYKHKQVRLTETEKVVRDLNYSVGANIVIIEGKYQLKGFWKNSAIEKAGLKIDEELVTVNGFKATDTDQQALVGILYNPQIEAINIEYRRDGQIFNTTIAKEKIIATE